ncbi:MAG: D-2-hydroxyacid dehydrogenase [Chloroflexi bacterium]|nr:D-2-hydroxyacid dehydrogenase [Chloroflexota bacterium]
MKVLVTAPWIAQSMGELAQLFPQIELIDGQKPEDALRAAGDVEVILGATSRELFAAAPKLRWLHFPAAGVEWLQNVPDLVNSNVIVTNSRGAHATTIAEHTFGMLVFLARDFATLYEAQKAKRWAWPLAKPGIGLVGLTMGIIGLGQIGRAVAKRAQAFEMNVIAVDAHPVPKPDYVAELRLLDGLNDLMSRADVVVVAIPITPETRGMLGPEQLRLMKKGSFLMVMSRGGIVDEPTVVQMLKDDHLAGAGFDVTAVEPLPADNELWTAPNVIITPHSSPSSQQTQGNVVALVKENLAHYLAGETLTNVVDKKLGY